MSVQRRTVLAMGGSALLALALPSQASSYPAKSVKLNVGFAAGGAADILARQLSSQLMQQTGQTFVVENRVGATGTIAAMSTKQSPADGYTLMLASQSTMVLSPILYPAVKFDTLRDFVPVVQMVNLPLVLVVNPAVNARTAPELLALAKSKPMHYASSGAGGPQHIAAEYFKFLGKVDIEHVPYNGEATALNDVLAGQVPMMFANLPVVAPHLKAGKLRALAITSPARHPDFPQLPSNVEMAGMGDFDVETWYGIFAPARTPPAVLAQLEAEIQKAIRTPELGDKLVSQGYRVIGSSQQEFTAFVQREVPRWKSLVEKTKMKVD